MQKGQAAIELLIILAVSMVTLIAIYSYSSTSMIELNKQKAVDEAQASVNSLATAANDVYHQGVGAKKQVFYIIPSGVDQSKSGIEADSFVLNVLGSDVYAKPNLCLLGEIPTTAGGHWVWLTAQEECVFVGVENIAVDKTLSYVTLSQDDSEQDTITITNNGSGTATLFLNKSWQHSDVTLELSSSTFSLAAAASKEITLTYSSNSGAIGNYPGTLSIGASFTSGDENISLPLNAEIIVFETDLILFPSTYSITLREDDVRTADLNVCNNGSTNLTSISFSDSGDTLTWIGAINSISSLAAGTCTISSFTITVPAGQSPGNYTGTITATDGGSNTDSTAITVTISPMADDFGLDWSTALFTPNGQRLWNWTIENTGDDTITIDKMTITWWNDTDNATLEEIRLNAVSVWDAGGGTSGQEINITNFSMNSGVSHSSNNRLEFNKRMNNESEDFQITFTFTDGSTYTTAVYTP